MSDMGKQTNKQNILLNKLLNKYDKRYVIRSFSVRQEDLPTLILFEELVQREGGKRKFSGLVMAAIQEYVRRHHPGNPQLPLTKFTKPRAQIPASSRPAPGDPRVKEKLSLVLAHLEKGFPLNPKAHRYYLRKAQENQDLPEAQKLLKLLEETEK